MSEVSPSSFFFLCNVLNNKSLLSTSHVSRTMTGFGDRNMKWLSLSKISSYERLMDMCVDGVWRE